ncbi:MAG TPA: orotate phosphoribosyltransferase [Candidatus Brocadiia bacterium]|nr:orotate phosphoribosyltransferase [Candidatus Brocadiales bacterium]
MNIDTKKLRLRLLEILKEKSLMFGDFKLSSGLRSNYYIDGKKTTLDPEGLYLIAEIILEMIKDDRADAIGGPTLGADSIVGAVTSLSFQKNCPVKGFIVRKEAKGHGTGNKIEGVLEKGSRVVIVEDVVTTGESIIKAINAVKELECNVVRIISIVDREQGARQRFAVMGFTYTPIFKLTDLGLSQ